jgi:hypothetical protein
MTKPAQSHIRSLHHIRCLSGRVVFVCVCVWGGTTLADQRTTAQSTYTESDLQRAQPVMRPQTHHKDRSNHC